MEHRLLIKIFLLFFTVFSTGVHFTLFHFSRQRSIVKFYTKQNFMTTLTH